MPIDSKNEMTVQSPDLESATAESNVSSTQIEKVTTSPRKKWVFLAAVAFVEVIIALAIVLPITLTTKTSTPTVPTPAPTFTPPSETDTIPSGIDLESTAPITWRQAGRTIRGFVPCEDLTSCVGLALSSNGQVLIASVPVPTNATTDDTIHDDESSLTHIQAYSLDNDTKSWVTKGSPVPLRGYSYDLRAIKVVVSADGNIVAVRRPGRVRVFRFDQDKNSWSQMGSDIVGSKEVYHGFGISVAMSLDGSIVVVGDAVENQVIAFRYNGAEWTQLGQALSGGGFSSFSRFGSSVALSDNGGVLAVLASGFTAQGYMKLFAFEADGWNEKFIYDAEFHFRRRAGHSSLDELGSSVALSGDGYTAAVALENNNGIAQAVKVFNFENEPSISTNTWDWEEVDIDLAVEGDFPVNVALSSDGSVLAATSSQRVTVFGYNSTVGWENITAFSVNTTENTYFSLALSKDATTIATAFTQRSSPYAPVIKVLRAHQA